MTHIRFFNKKRLICYRQFDEVLPLEKGDLVAFDIEPQEFYTIKKKNFIVADDGVVLVAEATRK